MPSLPQKQPRTSEAMPTGERPVTSGRASEELFAELLHDIRTPLSIISGRARLLQRRLYANSHGCDVIADISQIEDAAVRLEHLVDDLSQFQTFGRLVLSYETVDLNELVQQVAESCTDPTEDSRIVVLAGPSPSLPCGIARRFSGCSPTCSPTR